MLAATSTMNLCISPLVFCFFVLFFSFGSRLLFKHTTKKKKKKRETLIEYCPEIGEEIIFQEILIGYRPEIGEEIIFQEILPRLPVKSIFKFKLVCKKWHNLFTHDSVFAKEHFKKGANRTNTNFFSIGSLRFISHDSLHYELNLPERLLETERQFDYFQSACVFGSTNGLIYGISKLGSGIFISNPLTNDSISISPPTEYWNTRIKLAIVADPCNPDFGFTVVSPVHLYNDRYDAVVEFQVYSSETGEWQVSKNASEFRVPDYHRVKTRTFGAVSTRKKVYWSVMRHVLWFDIEKDVAGLIDFPFHDYLFPDFNYYYAELGVSDGEVSYSKMTMGGDIKIWLLRVKDINDEFEWVEKHTVRLQRIIDRNWNIFSKMCKNIKKRRKAAKVLARLYYIKPLPYSGGELVWFSINTINEMQIEQRVMVFNMRTRMLKSICDDVEIRLPLCPFTPCLLPWPT